MGIWLKKLISGGGQRTVAVKKHIFYSILLKGGGLVINLLLVPLYLGLLDSPLYGVWLTLSSIITWFQFFDLGLGNGLRNHLVESKSGNGDFSESELVSSTYAMVSIPAVVLILIFSIIPFSVDLGSLLHIEANVSQEALSKTLMWLGTSFGVQLVLRTITYVFLADQKASITNAINFTMNSILFLSLLVLDMMEIRPSIDLIALLNGLFPLIVLGAVSVYAFKVPYRTIVLNVSSIKLRAMKAVSQLGGHFFIIQLSAVVLFSTDNIIVSYLFDDEAVSQYAIHYKLFQVPLIAFSIVMQPLWSAYTQAKAQGDWGWIEAVITRLLKLYALSIPILITLVFTTPDILEFWLEEAMGTPLLLRTSMALYFSLAMFGSIFISAINGFGIVKLQTYFSVANVFVNIPLSIFFAKNLELGTSGIILASAICLSYGPFIAPFHVKAILNKFKNE